MPNSPHQSDADFDSQIVATLGDLSFTRAELSDAFDLVRAGTHWKAPIDAVIPMPSERVRLAIHLAVTFYTGSRATGTYLSRDGSFVERPECATMYAVKAAGYWASIGR